MVLLCKQLILLVTPLQQLFFLGCDAALKSRIVSTHTTHTDALDREERGKAPHAG